MKGNEWSDMKINKGNEGNGIDCLIEWKPWTIWKPLNEIKWNLIECNGRKASSAMKPRSEGWIERSVTEFNENWTKENE